MSRKAGRSGTRRHKRLIDGSIAASGAQHRKLHCELLEVRRLLTITVDSLPDISIIGKTNLRQAIAAASPGETIEFSVTGNITLDLSKGPLVIAKDLTIEGPGAGLLTIRGPQQVFPNPGVRLFEIDDGLESLSDVELIGLTLTNRNVFVSGPGGAIQSSENLTITECVLTENYAGTDGGAIFQDGGRLTVAASTITRNTATDAGGGIYCIDADVTIRNGSIVSHNSTAARSVYGGGGINARNGALRISSSEISFNNSSRGGGIYFDNGQLEITDASILNNIAGSTSWGEGGGLDVGFSASGTVSRSTISNNSANVSGGGLNTDSNITILECTISGNRARKIGAGGSNAGKGGGIFSPSVFGLVVENSTISGNHADISGGGIEATNSLTVRHTTITGNSAGSSGNFTSEGGGIGFSGHSMTLRHSIVAGNTCSTASFFGSEIYGSFSIVSEFNLLGDSSKTTASAFWGFAPDADDISATSNGTHPSALSAILNTTLTNNGGPTMTHALPLGSPAINAGNASFAGPPAYDQRGVGYGRVVSGRIDIGAFEAVSADFDQDGDIDGADFLSWQRGLGAIGAAAIHEDGNADGDADIDGTDLAIWKEHFSLSEAAGAENSIADYIADFDSFLPANSTLAASLLAEHEDEPSKAAVLAKSREEYAYRPAIRDSLYTATVAPARDAELLESPLTTEEQREDVALAVDELFAAWAL